MQNENCSTRALYEAIQRQLGTRASEFASTLAILWHSSHHVHSGGLSRQENEACWGSSRCAVMLVYTDERGYIVGPPQGRLHEIYTRQAVESARFTPCAG